MSLLFGSFKKFIADKSCNDNRINMKGFDIDGKGELVFKKERD